MTDRRTKAGIQPFAGVSWMVRGDVFTGIRHWMLLRIVSPAVTNITLATGAMMNWLDMIASCGETWIRSL
ncbi:hypothetical protein BFS25_10790 [Bifidobacterium longum subsp. infantis]|nr:hypothetical protein BFS25_10790 [Bifidobacterium longum subsp. infantis]